MTKLVEDDPEMRKAETGEELIGPWGAPPPVAKAYPADRVQLVIGGHVVELGEGADPGDIELPEASGKPVDSGRGDPPR